MKNRHNVKTIIIKNKLEAKYKATGLKSITRSLLLAGCLVGLANSAMAVQSQSININTANLAAATPGSVHVLSSTVTPIVNKQAVREIATQEAAAQVMAAQKTIKPISVNKTSANQVSANQVSVNKISVNTVSSSAQAVTAKQSTQADKKQIWNLQNADIRAVIPQIAKITGKNFIIDPRVSGKITVVSTVAMDSKEIYQVFLSSIQTLGYDVTPVDNNTYQIVPAIDAKYTAPLADGTAGPNQVVVQLVPIVNVSASELEPILRPLLTDASTITSYRPSNSLIIAGHQANVKRLLTIITQLDQAHASRIQMVHLEHADATDTVKMLQTLQTTDLAQGRVSNVSYAADTGTNSILISGIPSKLPGAEILVHQLDSSNNSAGMEVIHLNYLDASKFAATIQNMMKNSATKNGPQSMVVEADKATNSLLVHASGQASANIHSVIARLDVRPKQVLVEAVIAQVDSTLMHNFDVQWGMVNPIAAAEGAASSSGSAFNDGQGLLHLNSKYFPIDVLIKAIDSDQQSNLLSTPSVMVTNNQSALLSNGKTVSAVGQQSLSGGGDSGSGSSFIPIQSMVRLNADLSLSVTPQISPNGMIRLKVDQKNNTIEPGGNPNNPTIDTSEIKTNVMVRSGDILVLGGLLKSDHTKVNSGIPVLSKIPLLGRLFQSKDRSSDKTSLMVFIRPVVVNSDKTADRVTKSRYGYMRAQQMGAMAGVPLTNSENLIPAWKGAPAPMQLPSPFATRNR